MTSSLPNRMLLLVLAFALIGFFNVISSWHNVSIPIALDSQKFDFHLSSKSSAAAQSDQETAKTDETMNEAATNGGASVASTSENETMNKAATNGGASVASTSENETMNEAATNGGASVASTSEKQPRPANSTKEHGTKEKTENNNPSQDVYMEQLTHFFSHIPKSGTAYAAAELVRLHQATIGLPDDTTLQAISRAQKHFNKTLGKKNNFFVEDYKDNLPVDLTGATIAYTPPYICNRGITRLEDLQPYMMPWKNERSLKVKYKCVMTVTEKPWTQNAQNVYTVIREPLSHTLSQYFHCSESLRKRENFPPLKDWLGAYANIIQDPKMVERAKELTKNFNCYNPIESESVYTGFRDLFVPENYTYPYPSSSKDRNEELRAIDKRLMDDLKQKYNVIGDMSQMTKSVCAIFIDFTQGKHIPDVCDCTKINDERNNNRKGRFCLDNLQTHKKVDRNHCPLQIGYDTSDGKATHGVKHHGSEVLKNLPQKQKDMLVSLRRKDQLLYNISRAVFADQIEEMEARYEIKICEKWNRPWPALEDRILWKGL